MEKTAYITGLSTPAPSEQFFFHDSGVGKTFAVREATDEQLARLRGNVEQQLQQMLSKLTELQNALLQCGGMASAVNYEMDRRMRSLTIATELPKKLS